MAISPPHPDNPPAAGSPAYFDTMFADNDDPWGFRSRWYEERKRDLTLASLPRQRYGSAYEPGCANGELSAALAMRCDQLLVSDGARQAVLLARQRLQALSHVTVLQTWLPAGWPAQRFDLVVLSEIGYFLSPAALDDLIAKTRASLRPGGTVLACHWRNPIDGCALDGNAVQHRIGKSLHMAQLSSTTDADFLLDVWCLDGQSVAQAEHIA